MNSTGQEAGLITEHEPPSESSGKRRLGRPTLSNEALLDKALDLFLEQGFEGTSIDAITTAAGVAKRTVYMRYGDKETLFKAALQRAIEEWIVPVPRLQAAETEDFEQTLVNIGQILISNILTPEGLRLMRLTNAVSGRMPEIAAFNVSQGTEPTLLYLADLFRRRLDFEADGMPGAHDAALTFLHLVVGGPANNAAWGIELDPEAVDRHARYSIHLFLHGLLSHGRAMNDDEAGALQDENRRLRDLLVASMLETASLKEQLEAQSPDRY